MTEFFAMGGYAAYVWPALAVTAVVMAGLYIQSHRALHADEAELDALQQARAEAETEESHGPEA
ncbi:MAG: heme exporter protein CcmD [Alphaproteobacteria bacterium]